MKIPASDLKVGQTIKYHDESVTVVDIHTNRCGRADLVVTVHKGYQIGLESDDPVMLVETV